MNHLILFDLTNSAFAQHTLEILAMLSGAFALGVWLGWAIWAKYKFQIDQKDLDLQSNLATVGALREEVRIAREKSAVAEAECASLSEQYGVLSRENRMLDQERQSLENKLADLYAEKRRLDTELQLTKQLPQGSGPESVPFELRHMEASDGKQAMALEKPATSPKLDDTSKTEEMQEMPLPHLTTEPVTTSQISFLENTGPFTASNSAENTSGAFSAPADTAEPVPLTAPAADERDDLTVIEGIGTKIQMLLNQYGIFTYKQLSETEVTRLSELLAAAGPQLAMHNPGTWPSQAKLAADGQWETLTSVQGFLKGGKRPTL